MQLCSVFLQFFSIFKYSKTSVKAYICKTNIQVYKFATASLAMSYLAKNRPRHIIILPNVNNTGNLPSLCT